MTIYELDGTYDVERVGGKWQATAESYDRAIDNNEDDQLDNVIAKLNGDEMSEALSDHYNCGKYGVHPDAGCELRIADYTGNRVLHGIEVVCYASSVYDVSCNSGAGVRVDVHDLSLDDAIVKIDNAAAAYAAEYND